MAGKQNKPEVFVSKLRQVEVLQGQGMTIADAVQKSVLVASNGEFWH